MKLRKVTSLLLFVFSSLSLMATDSCEMVLERDIAMASARANLVPQWTPDGSKVVFSDGEVHVVESDGTSLWSISDNDADGAGTQSAFDYSPDVSPDGTRIVYATFRHTHWFSHNSELKMHALEGPGFRKLISTSKFKRLTRSEEDELNPAWSPNGDRIAFVSVNGVATMAADGSDIRQIVSTGGDSLRGIGHLPAVWSPDGRFLAFVAKEVIGQKPGMPLYARFVHYVVYVVEADGSNLTRLGDTLSRPGHDRKIRSGTDVLVNQPAWSPDGHRIAFAKFNDEILSLYTIARNGSDLRVVLQDIGAREGFWEGNLSWSPDGSEILLGNVTTERDSSRPASSNLVIRSDGSGERELPGPAGYALWSPDGSRIVVHTMVGDQGEVGDRIDDLGFVLYTMARDGSDGRVLVTKKRQDGKWVLEAANGVPLDDMLRTEQ